MNTDFTYVAYVTGTLSQWFRSHLKVTVMLMKHFKSFSSILERGTKIQSHVEITCTCSSR